MCGRFYLTSPSVPSLFPELDRYLAHTPPRNDIRPTQPIPVIRADRPIHEMQWWFVPNLGYVRDPREFQRHYATFNARIETVATSKVFSPAWNAGKRCIIPMSGYYEWQPIEGEKKKQRYAIAPTNNRLLFAAGLWERWESKQEGVPLESCTIIVRDAPEPLATIHDRAPVLIPDEWVSEWLATPPDQAMELLQAVDPATLKAIPVSGPIILTMEKEAHRISPLSK